MAGHLRPTPVGVGLSLKDSLLRVARVQKVPLQVARSKQGVLGYKLPKITRGAAAKRMKKQVS